MESNAVDLIHAHGVVDVQVAIRASLGGTVPIILTIHSPPPDEEEEFLEALVTSNERVSILVLSQYMKIWCRSKGLNCQVEVIPGLVDFEIFAPEFLPKPKDGGYLLCPARPVPRKGFEIVFEALGSFRRRNKEVPKLRVGGSGTTKELLLPHTKTAATQHVQKLIRLMESLGIEEHVVGLEGEARPFFNGIIIKHDRLPRIYRGSIATLYVPIREPFEEPFGLCVIEAMRMESVVIATSVGGIREIIDHGVTGFLVPPGAPSELRKAIELVLSDQRLRKTVTKAAAKEVRKYEASKVVDQIFRFYQRVTTGNLRAKH